MTSCQRSLAKGSTVPGPVPEGLIRLYDMRFCPYAQRARIFLIAKGIKHEIVNINLKNKPDWFFDKNPKGLVPSIEMSDGKIIYESPIVCDYLDEAFPGVKLIPSDPYAKAKQKMLLDAFCEIPAEFYKVMNAYVNNEDTTQINLQFLEKFKKVGLGEMLAKNTYLGGESVSFIDYMLWPWFERLAAFGTKDLVDKIPNIKAWQDRMLQDPAVKATFTEPEVFLEFFKLYSKNSVEAVDYGLN